MNFPVKKKPYQYQQGFTLIELMVALSLFVIVVLGAIGSLYSVNRASKKAASMRAVLDNVNFAVDLMARTLRTGSNIICDPAATGSLDAPETATARNCPMPVDDPNNTDPVGPAGTISVDSTFGLTGTVQFQLASISNTPGGPTKGIGNTHNVIQKRTRVAPPAGGTAVWGDWVTLTAPEVAVDSMFFYVDGAKYDDKKQPSVIIMVRGNVTTADGEVIPFSVQTFVSQRASEPEQ